MTSNAQRATGPVHRESYPVHVPVPLFRFARAIPVATPTAVLAPVSRECKAALSLRTLANHSPSLGDEDNSFGWLIVDSKTIRTSHETF
jgi:hypothetical protein